METIDLPTPGTKRTAAEAALGEPETVHVKRVRRHEDPEVDQLLDQILARNTVCRDSVETAKKLGIIGRNLIMAFDTGHPVIAALAIPESPHTISIVVQYTTICDTPRIHHVLAHATIVADLPEYDKEWFDIRPVIDAILADMRPERVASALRQWKICLDEYAGEWAGAVGLLMTRRDELLRTLSLFNLHDTNLDEMAKNGHGGRITATLEPMTKHVTIKLGKTPPTRTNGQHIMEAIALLYRFNNVKLVSTVRVPTMGPVPATFH